MDGQSVSRKHVVHWFEDKPQGTPFRSLMDRENKEWIYHWYIGRGPKGEVWYTYINMDLHVPYADLRDPQHRRDYLAFEVYDIDALIDSQRQDPYYLDRNLDREANVQPVGVMDDLDHSWWFDSFHAEIIKAHLWPDQFGEIRLQRVVSSFYGSLSHRYGGRHVLTTSMARWDILDQDGKTTLLKKALDDIISHSKPGQTSEWEIQRYEKLRAEYRVLTDNDYVALQQEQAPEIVAEQLAMFG